MSPDRLHELLKEFRQRSEARFAEEDDRHTVTAPIYHYTGPAGLPILDTNSIWLTDYRRAKDQYEVEYVVDIAREVLRGFASSPDRLRANFAKACLQTIDRAIANYRYLTASFCRSPDDVNLWDRYAAGGTGIALGLSEHQFTYGPLPANPVQQILVRHMRYSETELRERLAEIIHSAMDILSPQILRGNDESCIAKYITFLGVTTNIDMLMLAMQYKQDGYIGEQETRIACFKPMSEIA
ncbi:MAG TPA: hypothetical protein VGN75_06710 [Kaistia sp.]|jgi:hypothetical protein|nr:hypothetical protein [Kaistia sp.]